MFVGIQHPGESPTTTPNDPNNPTQHSSWPDGPPPAGSTAEEKKRYRPRSATIVITKDDGGVIGS
jgi:secreted PhoX family phosphatase